MTCLLAHHPCLLASCFLLTTLPCFLLTTLPSLLPQRILMHMDTHENHPDYGLATTPFVAPEGWPGYHILLSK